MNKLLLSLVFLFPLFSHAQDTAVIPPSGYHPGMTTDTSYWTPVLILGDDRPVNHRHRCYDTVITTVGESDDVLRIAPDGHYLPNPVTWRFDTVITKVKCPGDTVPWKPYWYKPKKKKKKDSITVFVDPGYYRTPGYSTIDSCCDSIGLGGKVIKQTTIPGSGITITGTKPNITITADTLSDSAYWCQTTVIGTLSVYCPDPWWKSKLAMYLWGVLTVVFIIIGYGVYLFKKDEHYIITE